MGKDVSLRMDLAPEIPDVDQWEDLIRAAIAEADHPRHAKVVWTGSTSNLADPYVEIYLDNCAYPGGVPMWDKPLVGSMGEVRAVRADGAEKIISLDDGHSWDDLSKILDDFMDEWVVNYVESISELIAADNEVRRVEKLLANARAARRMVNAQAKKVGITQYRRAKAVGRAAPVVQAW